MTKVKSKSNTLVFATSETHKMPWLKYPETEDTGQMYLAHSGIYSCTVDGPECNKVQNVAGSRKSDYKFLDGFFLMNMNFFVSSKNKESSKNQDATMQIEENGKNMDDGSNYLYGGAIYNHKEDYGFELYSWEILRANLDSSGNLQFHTYFKTMDTFDWNNCNFDCCPFNDEPDSNGYQAHRDRHDWEFMHAYIRTIPRAFAVDEKTGDVFISWEGFYKNCNPANHFSVAPNLEWTIGVSRLKTHAEDPECVAVVDENGEPLTFHEMSNNFAQCTVPVSIVAMESRGRNLQLPYGGLTVVPAVKEEPSPGVKPKRTFLMSVLDPKSGETHLLAISEGADATQNLYKRQNLHSSKLGPHLLQQSRSIWSGGNIKVHYNEEGRPDHLCRSVFDKGIRCIPIELIEDADSTYVTVTGEEETYLNEDQTREFCGYTPDATAALKQEPFFNQKTEVATGLDVVWNEEDGTPQRIFFGCFGHKSAGRIGSVEKDGENLMDALPGAYSGDVVFVPRELEVSAVRVPLKGEVQSSFNLDKTNIISLVVGLAITSVFVAAGLALYNLYQKRYPSPSRSAYPPSGTSSRSATVPTKYMELPVLSSRSNSTTDLSDSSSSDLSYHH